MTITIPNLVGTFEYPVITIGHLIKEKWSLVGADLPTFSIPTNTSTKDPWYSGQPPEIVFRYANALRDKPIIIGDAMFKCQMDVQIHIFAMNQQQEFKFINEVRRILKEWRRNPILKYSENPTPTNSGLKIIEPSAPDFSSEDPEEVGDVSETHTVGTVTAVWYEFRN